MRNIYCGPFCHSHINTGNKHLQSAAAACFITSSSLRLTYLLLEDNSLCRCPAQVIIWRRRDPLELWPPPKRGKIKMKWATFGDWREVKMSRYWCVLVSHPSVVRSGEVSSAPAEPWSLYMSVRLQGHRPQLALCECMEDFLNHSSEKRGDEPLKPMNYHTHVKSVKQELLGDC